MAQQSLNGLSPSNHTRRKCNRHYPLPPAYSNTPSNSESQSRSPSLNSQEGESIETLSDRN